MKSPRPSPSASATQFPEGKQATGNDGDLYVVRANKNGVRRWTKSKKKQRRASDFSFDADTSKRVVTVDNGGRPFLVYLVGKKKRSASADAGDGFWKRLQERKGKSGPGRAYVFYLDKDDFDSEASGDENYLFWKAIPYHNAFVGHDPEEIASFAEAERAKAPSVWKRLFGFASRPKPVWWHGGNSVLLQTTGSEYVFIGDRIFAFETPGDAIESFVSVMGGSAVPYPYAVGKRRVFLMMASTKDNVPLSAPVTPASPVPSPVSDAFDDPYDWLWPQGGNGRDEGENAKKAGIKALQGFREMFPRHVG